LDEYIFKYVPQPELEGEEFKIIPGSTSKTEASNKGRIRSARGKITYGYKNKEGYCVTKIDGKIKKVHECILVAFGFLKPSPIHTVDHGDRDGSNNCLENLSWKTPSEQMQNRDPNARSHAAQTSKGVKCLQNDQEYVSSHDAAKAHGISAWSVQNACNHGATPKGIGFEWIQPETLEGEEWRGVCREAASLRTGGSSAADEGARGAASLRTWTEFISVMQVARHFGVDPSRIKSRINQNQNNEEELEEDES
jgi:hypothetical protein